MALTLPASTQSPPGAYSNSTYDTVFTASATGLHTFAVGFGGSASHEFKVVRSSATVLETSGLGPFVLLLQAGDELQHRGPTSSLFGVRLGDELSDE